MEHTNAAAKRNEEDGAGESFRMILQDVYRFTDERFYVGRVVSGQSQAWSAGFLFSFGQGFYNCLNRDFSTRTS